MNANNQIPSFRVLLTDRAWPDTKLEREILSEVGAVLIEPPTQRQDQDERVLVELARDADAIATCWAHVSEPVIRAAPNCRIIARLGIGLDNIDVATATSLRIPVTNVPDYCIGEVADHALALMLACARNVAYFHLRTKRGEYNLRAAPPMRRLGGKTLGLVGFGRIGRNLFHKARALGMQVVANSASGNDHGAGCEMVSLERVLETSDFISLHVPSSPTTQHLLATAEFARMKPTCYLINTSRGAIVDQDALWSALRENRLAGAALDVFDPEPPDLSQPLFCDERVIVTPHASFLSVESLVDLRTCAARQIVSALKGERPENVVNPAVYE